MTTLHALAASGQPPAGGAAIGQVIGATTVAILLTLSLAWVGFAHRRGRPTPLGRVADWASRISGMPAWVALPAGLAGGSLICAVFGLYWDVSLHIDNGRDPGPLANPAHYFILIGLYGIFASGFLAYVMSDRRSTGGLLLGLAGLGIEHDALDVADERQVPPGLDGGRSRLDPRTLAAPQSLLLIERTVERGLIPGRAGIQAENAEEVRPGTPLGHRTRPTG